MKIPANKEQKQMWLYIIVLAVMIGILWLFFFQKQVARSLNQKQEASKEQKSLGEIFGQFKESITTGVNNFKEIKNSLPKIATTTIELESSGTTKMLDISTATENLLK